MLKDLAVYSRTTVRQAGSRNNYRGKKSHYDSHLGIHAIFGSNSRTIFIPALLVTILLTPFSAEAKKKARRTTISLPKPCKVQPLKFRKPAFRPTPGEEFSYDISAAGLYIGKVDIQVGEVQQHKGKQVIPLFGRARTASFASAFEKFVGRTMSLVDLKDFRPIVTRVQSQYGKDIRREHVRYSKAKPGIQTEYRYRNRERSRKYSNRSSTILDLLSTIHYARTLEIPENAVSCHEIYLDRRLWRMEARSLGLRSVQTLAGDKKAIAIEVELDRLPHRDFNPRKPRPWLKGVFYYSTDQERILLAFDIENRLAKGRGTLTRWSKNASHSRKNWRL